MFRFSVCLICVTDFSETGMSADFQTDCMSVGLFWHKKPGSVAGVADLQLQYVPNGGGSLSSHQTAYANQRLYTQTQTYSEHLGRCPVLEPPLVTAP